MIQSDIKTWGELAKDNGPWFILALLLLAAIRWWFIPRLDKKESETREQNERLIAMVNAQLDEAKRANKELTDKFVNTVDTAMNKQAQTMERLIEKIEGIKRGR